MKFLFCQAPGLAGKLIRLFDRGVYNHVAVVVSDTEVIEATYVHGVRKRGLGSLMRDRPIHLLVELPMKDEQAAIAFATSKLGGKYDWKALASLAIRRVFNTAPHWEDKNAYFCDELVLLSAVAGGGLSVSWAGRYGVQSALELLISNGAVVVEESK